jgi:hypothetical protein
MSEADFRAFLKSPAAIPKVHAVVERDREQTPSCPIVDNEGIAASSATTSRTSFLDRLWLEVLSLLGLSDTFPPAALG